MFGAKAETGQNMKPEISAPARPSDYSVCGINQHPSNYMCYSLSFSAASEDDLSITPGGPPESGASLYPTTQDMGRRLPIVTTAPPVNVPNHHPLYRNPPHQVPIGPRAQPNYFEDSKLPSSHPTFSTLASQTLLGNSGERASHDSAESSNMQTTLGMNTSAATSQSNTPAPVTSVVLQPEPAATIPSAATAAREEDVVRPNRPGLKHNVRLGSDEETTTTIITTMQSPGKMIFIL